MPSVIDLELARKARQDAEDGTPDAHLVRRDEYGRPVYCYSLEYTHRGDTYGLDFWAYSEAEAMDHVLSMIATLMFVGQKMGEMPA